MVHVTGQMQTNGECRWRAIGGVSEAKRSAPLGGGALVGKVLSVRVYFFFRRNARSAPPQIPINSNLGTDTHQGIRNGYFQLPNLHFGLVGLGDRNIPFRCEWHTGAR